MSLNVASALRHIIGTNSPSVVFSVRGGNVRGVRSGNGSPKFPLKLNILESRGLSKGDILPLALSWRCFSASLEPELQNNLHNFNILINNIYNDIAF